MDPINPPIRLTPDDAWRYTRLRTRMLRDAPWAFAASEAEEGALDPARFAKTLGEPDTAIFAIEAPEPTSPVGGVTEGPSEDGRELIAAAGISRVSRPKLSHRAEVWGVFVDPAYRGRGLARTLLTATIDLARGRWPGVDYVDLGVSEGSPVARHLYESLGFRAWGREPESLEYNGRRYDEIFMALRIGEAGKAPKDGP